MECSTQEDPIFKTNGGESNLFGLEPNFGCCTANLSQPWPKFALSTFMESQDGIAAIVYAPSSLKTKVKDADVSIRMDTQYPFRDTINFVVNSSRPVEFTIWLRIPDWTKEPRVEINNNVLEIDKPGFYPLKMKWEGQICFTLKLPMTVSIVPRPNNLYAVTRGPLVYSLPIEEEWVQINQDIEGREFPHCDYEVLPKSPWNYGLCIDKDNVEESLEVEELLLETVPSRPRCACGHQGKGRKVDWEMEKALQAPAPGMDWICDEVEELMLIPYGCTNLRITEIPLV